MFSIDDKTYRNLPEQVAYVSEQVAEAVSIANTATELANNAVETANSVTGAIDTANTALTNANTAIESANAAYTAATSAQTTAETFYNDNKTVVEEAKSQLENISTTNDAAFGANVEVDGDLTLNSRDNIKLTETPTDTLALSSELTADYNALDTKIEANTTLIGTKADSSELTSFIDTYYANAYNFRYGGTVFDIYEIGATCFDFRRSGFSDLVKATRAIGMFQGAIFNIEYITDVVHIYLPKFANVNNLVNDQSLFRNVTVRHYSSVTDPKIHVHVSAARLGVTGYRMFEYEENDATWLKEVDAELMDDGESYPRLYNCSEMFAGCTSLEVVGYFDMQSAYSLANMFRLCSSLKEIHCTHWNKSFDISASTQFEEEALVEIIGNLDTVSTAQTLTMGSTNLAKLTTDEILVATGKGWTLA